MVDKIKSKHELSQEMAQEIANYLETGGEIKRIKQGVSGRDGDPKGPRQAAPFSISEKQTRTLLNDTVKAIDERKQKKKPASPAKKKPKKKIIYDDFGEPIREIWE